MESEGEETLVADVVDVERTTVTSWRLLFGTNWELRTCCVVVQVEQSIGVVWHMDSEGCSAERTGWDSCTGVGRSSSGSVDAGRGEEEETGDVEEESGVKEYDMVSWVGGLLLVSMLLSLMSTVVPL